MKKNVLAATTLGTFVCLPCFTTACCVSVQGFDDGVRININTNTCKYLFSCARLRRTNLGTHKMYQGVLMKVGTLLFL